MPSNSRRHDDSGARAAPLGARRPDGGQPQDEAIPCRARSVPGSPPTRGGQKSRRRDVGSTPLSLQLRLWRYCDRPRGRLIAMSAAAVALVPKPGNITIVTWRRLERHGGRLIARSAAAVVLVPKPGTQLS